MLTAAVMTCGGIEFKTKGRDDQAECENIGPDSKSLHAFIYKIRVAPNETQCVPSTISKVTLAKSREPPRSTRSR